MAERTLVPASAWALAQLSHAGQRTRLPPEARTTALLHEILDLSPSSRRKLLDAGLSRVELAALRLLTHSPGEPDEVYVRRIADAPGHAGQLARTVKLADLNDISPILRSRPALTDTRGPGSDY